MKAVAALPLVPPEVGRVRFDRGKGLWLWGMLLPGAVFGLPALTWELTAVSTGLSFAGLCVGHSVILHRGIIHRSYEMPRRLRNVMIGWFMLTGLGGPVTWARLHAVRDYWQNRKDCPRYFAYDHGIWKDFWWNLHLGFEPADRRAEAKLPPDVLTDPWLNFLERTWPLHVLPVAAVLWVWGGADAVAVGVCLRVAGGILGHWFVGYCAHKWGETRHVVEGAHVSGTNVWALGVVSFGEGFHNNHHAFPDSARIGQKWHELDMGWLVVRAFEKGGLIHGVKVAALEADRMKGPSSRLHGRRKLLPWAKGEV